MASVERVTHDYPLATAYYPLLPTSSLNNGNVWFHAQVIHSYTHIALSCMRQTLFVDKCQFLGIQGISALVLLL